MSDPTANANGDVAVLDDVLPMVPEGTTPESDGVYLKENGKVLFVIDGAPYTLRGPKVGEFRRLHSEWMALVGKTGTELLDHQIGWVRLLFNGDPAAEPPMLGLSDHHLPDDSDEWSAWVGAASYQSKVMIHFRDVPLARGGTTGN